MQCQGLAIHVRHDEVRDSIDFAGTEDPHDVRMLELGDGQDLASKACCRDPGGQFMRQDLYNNLTMELAILCEEDARHAAPDELSLEVIMLAQAGANVVGD